VPIYDHQQSVYEERVKSVLFPSHPEEVVQRRSCHTRQACERPTQKKWHVLRSTQQLLKETVSRRLISFIGSAAESDRRLLRGKTVGNGILASSIQMQTNALQECRKMQTVNCTERDCFVDVTWRSVTRFVVRKRAWRGEVLLVA